MTLATVIRCSVIAGLCIAQATIVTEGQGAAPDYRLAQRFLGDAIRQLVYDGVVAPRWIGTSGRFWYVKDGHHGLNAYCLVVVSGFSRIISAFSTGDRGSRDPRPRRVFAP